VNNLEGRAEVARITEESDGVGTILDIGDSHVDCTSAKVEVLCQNGATEGFRSDVENDGSAVRDLFGCVGGVPSDGLDASNDPGSAFIGGVNLGNEDVVWAARNDSGRGLDERNKRKSDSEE